MEFSANSSFHNPTVPSREREKEQRKQERIERERQRIAQVEKTAAKEDAIHALRRIEMDLRREDKHDLADDLDAAISQVIMI